MEEVLGSTPAEPREAPTSIFERLYPEYGAGGFSRCDLWVPFFTRVNALLRPDMTVVDYGAGRGVHAVHVLP